MMELFSSTPEMIHLRTTKQPTAYENSEEVCCFYDLQCNVAFMERDLMKPQDSVIESDVSDNHKVKIMIDHIDLTLWLKHDYGRSP